MCRCSLSHPGDDGRQALQSLLRCVGTGCCTWLQPCVRACVREASETCCSCRRCCYYIWHRTSVVRRSTKAEQERDVGRRLGLVRLPSSWGRFGHGRSKLGCGLHVDWGLRFSISWQPTHTTALGSDDQPVSPP